MGKKYNWHQNKLSELIYAMYGYKTVDYYVDKSSGKNIFKVCFGASSGLISKFSTKTDRSQQKLRELFQHTFMDKKVDFESKRETLTPTIVTKKTLFYFIGEEELKNIITRCNSYLYKRYFPTTQSIFAVMENYDALQGIPVICTEEQFEDCKREYGEHYFSSIIDEEPIKTAETITVKRFLRKHADIIDGLSELIYTLLVDDILPVICNKNSTEAELEAQYRQAYDNMKVLLKDAFMAGLSRKIVSNKQIPSNVANQIILVDPTYKFGEPEMRVIYCPEHSPILTDWHIPQHQYVTYQKPDIRHEDVKNLVSCLIRGASDQCGLIHPDSTKPILQFPISDKKVLYQQSMFQNFQILYLTFSNNPHYSVSLFEYLGYQDEYISNDIMEREKETIRAYWESVFESLSDMLQRIFKYSIDFVDLIKESPDKNVVNRWLEIFCQKELLKLDENSFSAFLSQDLLMRHYVLQWGSTPTVYRDMIGDDYISEHGIKQLAYIIIPLIGEFVSELQENAKRIADFVQTMPMNKCRKHLRELKSYISETNLERAILQWDECYKALMHHKTDQHKIAVGSDDNLLGLKDYAKSNGNLFKNLKNAIELYCAYLEDV